MEVSSISTGLLAAAPASILMASPGTSGTNPPWPPVAANPAIALCRRVVPAVIAEVSSTHVLCAAAARGFFGVGTCAVPPLNTLPPLSGKLSPEIAPHWPHRPLRRLELIDLKIVLRERNSATYCRWLYSHYNNSKIISPSSSRISKCSIYRTCYALHRIFANYGESIHGIKIRPSNSKW